MFKKKELDHFKHHVDLKYRVYNSVFLTLQFEQIKQTGIQLPVLHDFCQKGYAGRQNPIEILENFFKEGAFLKHTDNQLDLLFRLIQYMERQVVLIDALEDAAFSILNDVEGSGTIANLTEKANVSGKQKLLAQKLKNFKVRIVLTAHPTQFYPGSVLAIITDLAHAIKKENLLDIKLLLEQLGKTPFFKREKPTPYDEAVSLNWYLENVLYESAGEIIQQTKNLLQEIGENPQSLANDMLEVGFWPGGDRDGNPYVNRSTTIKVARRLKNTLLKCYYQDVRRLKRRITFRGVDQLIEKLDKDLYQSIYISDNQTPLDLAGFISCLQQIEENLRNRHNNLFVDEVTNLLNKVHCFGFHFATLDIRQDSRVLQTAFSLIYPLRPQSLNEYFTVQSSLPQIPETDEVIEDTIHIFQTIRQIQEENGEKGCNRFIISNCNSPESVLQVLALARFNGWNMPFPIDVVPLFETITDLENAGKIMQQLYSCTSYKQHLQNRENKQVVMLGFSDGTKDGGYFAANWNIYKAKETISQVSAAFGVEVIFFDGRGGPPARGGGDVHRFYAAQSENIAKHQIQLTIQGQTVSSKFGNKNAARFFLEQLITAGIGNTIKEESNQLTEEQRQLMESISSISLNAYLKLKNHPQFVDYLATMSPLPYFGQTNIASRPTKRGNSDKLSINDLRAIPFVGAWSQLKQNVPGYFGFGTALESLIAEGKLEDLKLLYKQSPLFRALVSNSMQSLSKCFFPLTDHMTDKHPFTPIRQIILEEYQRSCTFLLKVSEMPALMANTPKLKASIELREEVVLPLLTIQQYALMKLQEEGAANTDVYQKLIIRSMYGIINAARNSA